MNFIKEIKYTSWNHFKKEYCNDIFGSNLFQKEVCMFRGQGNAEWELKSSFDRKYGNFDWKIKKKIEKEILKDFKENCLRNVYDLSIEKMEEIELKNMAQHYGVPTRLLDWSYSPFIAAYFAFSNAEIDLIRCSNCIAIWVLFRDHEIWNSNIGVKIEERLLTNNEHQKKQLGCFTVINHSTDSIDKFIENCSKEKKDTKKSLYKILIPAYEKKAALFELDAMNINASTVFGGYEGCAKAATDMIALKYMSCD